MKTTTILFSIILFFAACCSEEQKTGQATAAASDSSAAMQAEHTAIISEVAESPFSDIKVGMRDEKVTVLLGKPSKVDVINAEVGERVEDWWYGNNQKIRITGGQVTRIVKNVAKEQDTLLKIKEAKERGDDAEAKRLQDEIDANN